MTYIEKGILNDYKRNPLNMDIQTMQINHQWDILPYYGTANNGFAHL